MSTLFLPHGLLEDGDKPNRNPPSSRRQDLPAPRLTCGLLRYKCDRPRVVNCDGILHRFCQVHRNEHQRRGRTRSRRRGRADPYVRGGVGYEQFYVGLLPDESISLDAGTLIALRAIPVKDINDVLRGIDTLLTPAESDEDNRDAYTVFFD